LCRRCTHRKIIALQNLYITVSPEKSHILSFDIVDASERYATIMFWKVQYRSNFMQDRMECTYGQVVRYLQGSPVAMKTPTCRLYINYQLDALIIIYS